MTWEIDRVDGAGLDIDEVIGVLHGSGLAQRRPVHDRDRIRAMLGNANLVVTCRTGERLIGLARSISDFSYVTYLSDIAVVREHQHEGIGRALIRATRLAAPAAKLVLLSAPDAVRYYPRVGFTQHQSAWVIQPGEPLS